jgi:glycosyltransferase involved in cell wall biosynthesis
MATPVRVLLISSLFPVDSQGSVSGGYQRLGLFVESIRDLSSEIDVLYYVPSYLPISNSLRKKTEDLLHGLWGDLNLNLFLAHSAEAKEKPSNWEVYGRGIISVFKQESFMGTSGPEQVKALDVCLDRKPSWIFAHWLRSMCPLLRTHHPLPPVLFDLDTIEHLVFWREIRQPPVWKSKPLLYFQVPALIMGERRSFALAERTFVCSELDRSYLSRRFRGRRIVAIPNATRVPELRPEQEGTTLLFVASFTYAPNLVAGNYLISKIWPLVHKKMPSAELLIAGVKCERLKAFGSEPPGVNFLGFVRDIESLYQRSGVVCCPILWGGGTRTKIIEAAAFGKAVVSTAIGAEGLDFEDGRDILIRDRPEHFAEACTMLLNDRVRRREIGLAARNKVLSVYNRESVITQIKTEITRSLPHLYTSPPSTIASANANALSDEIGE